MPVQFQSTTLATPPASLKVASDTVSTNEYQHVKIALGADGVFDGLLEMGQQLMAASVPVVIASDQSTIEVVGDAAENAAVAGNPVLVGGRYDVAPRTLGDGDVGAIALAVDGAVHIDDGGNSITIDNADITTIAGAVSGSEMQVDVVAALPTGTNSIGNIGTVSTLTTLTTITNDVNIADGGNVISVDDGAGSLTIDNATLSVVGGGVEATALRVTIANDSTGVLSVDDNGSTLSVDDGAGSLTIDNATLSVTGGGVEASALRVTLANDSTGTLTVDNAGTFVVQEDGAALTALQLIDDPVFADDAAFALTTSKTMVAGVIRDDNLTTLAAIETDVVPLRVDYLGALHTNPHLFQPGTVDIFGHISVGALNNQVDVQFFRDAPENLVTVTTAGGGTATQVGGSAEFATTTAVTASSKGVSTTNVMYRSASEIYLYDSVRFTTPTSASSYQRLGLYDTNDGVFIGYEGTSFGITIRNAGSDTTVAKASFSEDDLTGSAGSRFTRDGSPEAITLTNFNVFRIRFGWLGSAPIFFEVLSPDGEWVTFHRILQPNNATISATETADLPVTIDVSKTSADATNLIMATSCWGAGVTNENIPLDTALTDDTLAGVRRSVITGKTAGGTYVNVQTTNSGNFKIALDEYDGVPTGGGVESGSLRVTLANDSTGLLSVDDNGGSLTVDNAALSVTGGGVEATALRVTIANDSTGLVSVDDGGGSLTVDGTVTANAGTGTFTVTDDGSFTLAANSGVDIGDVDILSVIPGTGATNLGKIEDAGHTTADVGVMALAVRNDGGAALAGTDLDYIPLGTDSSGNLYVNVAAGSSAGTEYTEDDAGAANPSGPQSVMIRQDTPAGLTTTDGDVVGQRATDYGAAFVQVLDSSGNFINSFGGSGGTSHADDAAFTIGSASSITPTGYLADETTPDSVDEGDVGVPRMTLTRKPYAVITDPTSENNAAVDGSGHLQVDIAASSANVTVVGTGTLVVQEDGAALTALQLIDDVVYTDDTSTHATGTSKGAGIMAAAAPTDGSVDANDIGMLSMSTDRRLHTDTQIVGQDADITIADGGNAITVDWAGTAPPIGAGTEAAALRVTLATDSTGLLSVDDNGGSLTVDSSDLAIMGGWDNAASDGASVSGDVAHDTADAGEPVKVGAHALDYKAARTAVADDDRVDLAATREGLLWVLGGSPDVITLRLNATAAQTDVAIVTVSAGTAIVVSRATATLDNACSVDVQCRIGFGTATTSTTTGTVLSHPGIAPGSGVVEGNGGAALGVGLTNEDLRVTAEVPTGGSLDIVVSYHLVAI